MTPISQSASAGVLRPAFDDAAHADAPVFELGDMRELLGFPRRAVRRHRALAGSIFAGIVVLSVLAAALLPRHYRVETKFFAERNVVMPALNNPKRAVPGESDAPTKLAADAVLKRDNLIEIIRETNLMATWPEVRSPAGKVRDAIVQMVRGPMSDSDRVDAMVGLLEKRMWVAASDEGTVTIGIDWVDPSSAYRIVQSSQQNFFEQRHAAEVSMIGESIAILGSHVASAQQSIDEALTQIREAEPVRTPGVARIAPPVARVTPEVAALQAELTSKRQTIADLELSRNQRLSTLQTHLAELRNSYGPAHPEVVATQDNIRALSTDSPQIVALRAQATTLQQQLAKLGVRAGDVPTAASLEPTFARAALDRLTRPRADSLEDPKITYAKSRLKIATSNFEDLLDRLESATIELETARAAFKYRFNVITPAQIPKKAEKPSVPLLLIGGLVLATGLAVFAAVVLDLGRGHVLEPWQVQRALGLPVLAEVRIP